MGKVKTFKHPGDGFLDWEEIVGSKEEGEGND